MALCLGGCYNMPQNTEADLNEVSGEILLRRKDETLEGNPRTVALQAHSAAENDFEFIEPRGPPVRQNREGQGLRHWYRASGIHARYGRYSCRSQADGRRGWWLMVDQKQFQRNARTSTIGVHDIDVDPLQQPRSIDCSSF